jgi:hypothetical protein
MSHNLNTSFARHRFTPRTSNTTARDAYACEHYAPASAGPSKAAGYGLAVFVGMLLGIVLAWSI